MTYSPSHDIILYLEDRGIGAFGGNSDFSMHDGGLPSNPDRAIGIASSTGAQPDTDQMDIFQPGFQVLVRSTNKAEAYQMQCDIRDLLIYPIPVDTPSSVFSQIELVTDFLDIGQDQNLRYIWSANYRTRRTLKPQGVN